MTRSPRCSAMRVAMSPIGPAPTTRRVPPSSTSAYSTACHAVGRTSERKRNRSSGGPCGTLIGRASPNGHAQHLGLAAGHLAVELAVAEQARAGAGVAVLGGLALAEQLAVAHPARAAADVERHDDAVADLQRLDGRADLAHDAHRLVADDVARRHERRQRVVEVQVGAAQPGRRDVHDDVGRLLARPRPGTSMTCMSCLPCHVTAFMARQCPPGGSPMRRGRRDPARCGVVGPTGAPVTLGT